MHSAQEKYILDHSDIANPELAWLEKQTNLRTNYSRMLSGSVQGELLMLLAKMCRAKHILEIGCFTGYSSICLAEGLCDGGCVDSLEINDELEDLILQAWDKAGVSDRTHLYIGDALTTIEELAKSGKIYDLVYIDANKREYLAYYKAVKPLLRKGGIILADDTMLGGKVYDTPDTTDKQTRGLIEFNEFVKADSDVEVVILPLRDGLSLIRKK